MSDGSESDRRPQGSAPLGRGVLAHLRHELGTPLNAIIGYSEMLLEDHGAAPPGTLADLQAVREAGRTLLALVADALDPSKAAAGLLDRPLAEIGAALLGRLSGQLADVAAAGERLLALDDGANANWRPDIERVLAAGRQVSALLQDLTPLEPEGGARAAARAQMESSANLVIESLLHDQPESARGAVRSAADAGHVLVVDDNETNRDILARILQRQGHRVTTAAGGQAALAALACEAVDIVLLDILMPELNGFQVLQLLKADDRFRHLPVVFISALDDTVGKVQAFRAGGVDYVTKPFQPEEVVARVDNQLQLSRLQKDLARQNEELVRKNEELVRAQQRTDLVFSALADALPGTVIDGKYRLGERIGSGGFGAVFRGRHLGLDLEVAIKVFRPVAGNDTADALERFRQEGIAASRIKHPNAIEIFDSGISATGIAYLVMELVHGHTLEEELRARGVLSLERAAAILAPVCDALAEVHAAGIVHRDISPENIFLHQGRKGEVVKLLDFGLSKILEDPSDRTRMLTVTGSVAGTPAYMAPERLMNGACDGRADVYSVGVILYRMLCGRPPFEAPEGGLYAVALSHILSEPAPLPAHGVHVPDGVASLVARTMARSPHERPTASELAALLRQFTSDSGESQAAGRQPQPD